MEVQPADTARPAGLEKADEARLQPLLADRRAVGAKRQPGALRPYDDELVGVGPPVPDREHHVAGRQLLRRRDPEVAFGDANDRPVDARRGPARAAPGHREQRQRTHYQGRSPTRRGAQQPSPQMHESCFDRNEVSRAHPNGGGSTARLSLASPRDIAFHWSGWSLRAPSTPAAGSSVTRGARRRSGSPGSGPRPASSASQCSSSTGSPAARTSHAPGG